MVRRLKIREPRLREVLARVRREEFVPPESRSIAYRDAPVPLADAATVSAPHMVVLMLEALAVEDGNQVLEIGAGLGYLCALLAELVGPSGGVEGLEIDARLAAEADRRLAGEGYGGRVRIHALDGAAGWAAAAPYDRIVVSCATPSLRPEWIAQLAPGGRLVAPVGDEFEQVLTTYVAQGAHGRIVEGVRCRFVRLRRAGTPHI